MPAPDRVATLVERTVAGDRRAATELVRGLAPKASRIIRSLAGATAEHEDLVQDALVALVRSLPSFEGRSTLETYLYGICLRIVRHHRRSGVRMMRALQSFFESRTTPDSEPAWDGATSDRARAVHRLLERLPPRRREVLVLFELEDRSAAEIAEILGIPEATVYTRLHHARKAFRRLAERAPELRGEDDG